MRNGKKFLLLTLPAIFCLMGMLLAACGSGTVPGQRGSGSQTKAPTSQQVFRWAFRLPDIASFDPGIAQDETSLDAVRLVFTGLVGFDDSLKIQPMLAQTYDVTDNGLTYTFHLRPNLKFSDGTKLDANDIAYSVDRSLSPDINNQSGVALTYLGLIKNATERTQGKVNSVIGSGVVVSDPNTIVFHLTKPAAYFLGALTYPTSFPVEKSVIDKWGAKWTEHLSDNGGQGGIGPFKVKSYSHTTGIKFVPNPNYYGPKPQLQELDYAPYKDRQTSYNAYLANQADLTAIPLSEYQSAKSRNDFQQNPALTIFYVGMNYLVKPLDNIHVRQGLAAALNRDAIVQVAWHGAYIPSCHIVPQGMYGYDANLTCPAGTTTKGDQSKAKQLFNQGLQEEGLTASKFPTITMTYPSDSPEAANEAATEVQMWKNVLGITINTATASQNSMYTLEAQTTGHNGPLQMWLGGWGADYPDPQDWITLQFGQGEPYNNFNYGQNSGATAAQQQTLQKQMLAADVMSNSAERLQAYNKIEQQLVNDVSWLSIYQRPDIWLVKPYVANLKFNAASSIAPNDWNNIYITQH